MAHEEPSYIDYETFLNPAFSPIAFANKLVLATNEPSDTSQDLSTPLSKVLFDVQEIDTHIDTLTTQSALPLVQHTCTRVQAGQRILDQVEDQVANLVDAYNLLKSEVIDRHEAAQEVHLLAQRMFQAVRLARAVGRALLLGRQLEVHMCEFAGGTGNDKLASHYAMARAANTIASLKTVLAGSGVGHRINGLDRVTAICTLQADLMAPAETLVITQSQRIIKEFSLSSWLGPNSTSMQSNATVSSLTQHEQARARVISALSTLYLLSPLPSQSVPSMRYLMPSLVISTLHDYLQTCLKSSIAALARALATMPTLERTLVEVSARCQNILALEVLLSSTTPPSHVALGSANHVRDGNDASIQSDGSATLLQPLLSFLDSASLPSFFWRSLASALSPRVVDILNKGGVSARQLRASKDRVRELVRNCVDRGSQLPAAVNKFGVNGRSWEREAAVMIAAVVGPLAR